MYLTPGQTPTGFNKTLLSPVFPKGADPPVSAKVTESTRRTTGLCHALSSTETLCLVAAPLQNLKAMKVPLLVSMTM